MGYGKKGWFKTYITMMKNSFQYAKNTGNSKWEARGFALMFSVVWKIVKTILLIGIPIVLIVALLIILL